MNMGMVCIDCMDGIGLTWLIYSGCVMAGLFHRLDGFMTIWRGVKFHGINRCGNMAVAWYKYMVRRHGE